MSAAAQPKKPEGTGQSRLPVNALLAAASAGLFWLSFPPVDFGWAAWVALVPWLILIRRAPPKKAALWSAAAGAAAFIALLHWIRFVTFIGWIPLALYCAAYWPAAALLLGFLRRRGVAFTWAAPLVLVAMEFIRGRLMTGFPFFFLGHSQHDALPLIQVADIAGVFGVTFVVAMVNGFLAERILDRFKSKRPALTEMGATAFVLAAVFGYGMFRLQTVNTVPGPKVCLIQANIPISLKHSLSLDETLQTLKDHVELTREVAEPDTDLVIWAETMMPAPMNQVADADLIRAFLMHKDETYRRSGRFLADCAGQLKDALSAAETTMLIGAETRGEKRYNSAYLITPDGDIVGRYDKMHLVVFGEYTPLTRLFPFLKRFRPAEMGGDLAPGRYATIFRLPPREETPSKFGVTICYEDAEPRVFRRFVRYGARFMVNITNDGWFRDSSELDHHLHVCAFRAVENRVPVARCANTGVSALIEPTGRVARSIADAAGNRRAVKGTLTGTLAVATDSAPYTRIGDVFAWLCLLALVAVTFLAGIRARKS